MYTSDAERTKAIGRLLGTEPPRGLQGEQILAWAKMQTSYGTRVILVVAYAATLLTAIVIVSMALFRPPDGDAHKAPVLIDTSVERPKGSDTQERR
jgi:hypothetical protein